MALEDGFYTLADRLTELTRQIGQGGGAAQARPETTSIEAFENAVSENFDQLQETLSEMDGGEVQQEVTLSEESVETIVTANQTQLEGSFEEAIQPEDPEEVTEEVEGVPAFNLSAEREQVQALFDELESSADITDEELQQAAETFEEFEEKITNVSEEVEKGNLAFDQASEKIVNLASTAREEFSEVVGNVEPAQEAINQYFQSVEDRIATQEGVLSATGEDLAQVGGAIGQIGDQQFLGNIGQTIDRLSAVASGGEAILPSQEQLQQSNSLMGAISESARNFASNITRARVALAGLLAPLAIAADLLEDAFGVARDFRQETGIGAERMRELRNLTADVSTELAGFGLDPAAVGDVALSLVDRFGSIETATAQSGENLETLISQSGRLAGALGVSAERGAEITGTFVELESLIGGSAERGAALTNELAQARDVAPQEAFEQITSNAEQLSQFSGNTTESLAEAAVQAQQLGTSLGTVADFQEQALGDITGQIQQLQEAQMLTGQQLDATALISASYQGTEETLTEITDQLEGIDFENLDFFQRQALQEAFPGFSLSELERLSRGREILEETNTTLQRAQAIAAGDLTFEQAVRADDVDEVERLRRQFNQLYFVIAENLFPIVSDLLGAVTAFTPVLEYIAPVAKGVSSAVRLLGGAFQALEVPIRLIQDAIFGTKESSEKLDESMQNLSETVSSVFGPFDRLLNYFGVLKQEGEAGAESISLVKTSLESLGTLLGTYELAAFFTGLPSAISGITSKLGGLMGGFGRFIPFMSTASDEVATATKTMGNFGSTAENTSGVLSRLGGKFSGMLPNLQRMGALFRLGRMRMVGFLTRLPLLGPALSAVSGAFSTAATSVYGFATSLSATGIGAIILGIAAAIGGAVYAFYNWEETVRFLSDTFDSFMSSAFGVKNATEKITPALSTVGDFFVDLGGIIAGATIGAFQGLGTAIYALGDAFQWLYTTLQLDHIVNFVGFMGNKIGGLIASFYEGKSAGEALGSTLGLIFNPFGDYINFLSEVIGLFHDLGSAIVEGNFSNIGSILLEGLEGIGRELVDMIIPDGIQSYVAEKMEGLTSTITSYLPFSPAEMGPLSNLDQVDIGGEVARTIRKEPVEREMEGVGSTITSYIPGFGGDETQAIGEAAEAGEVGVQAERPGVATVDQDIATGPQQAAAAAQQAGAAQAEGETQEVRLDSETDNVKGVLQDILNTQQQLLQDLRDGKIAVYLDGRKVNKELVRGLGLVE